jgi:hypothetical protein
MKEFFLTCDYNPGMLKLIKGKSVVFYCDDFSALKSLHRGTDKNKIHIHCIVINTNTSLSDILFQEEWSRYPLAIESPSMGRVYKFLSKVNVIRKLNVRFYFSTKEPSCYKDIRILSSLGYATALFIDGEKADWQQLTDLMTYSLLNSGRHAEIHPFSYVSKYYHPHSRTDFDSVYFNDPERYLHINSKGTVFLKREDLYHNINPCCDSGSIEFIEENDAYINEKNKWFEFFLKPSRCASCKGWRICLGKYVKYLDSNPGCDSFFSEFIDAIELEKNIEKRSIPKEELWQP